MTRFALTALSLLAISASLPSAAQAQEDHGTLSFTVENDLFAGSDRHYTNGLRVALVTAPKKPTVLERFIAGERAHSGTFRRSFAASHAIYTPEYYLRETPYDHEHPYAGNLFGEYAFMTEKDGRWDIFTMEVGIVGPWALGEETQNWFHRTINMEEANGWAHQIDNEVTVNVAYDWKSRPFIKGNIAGIDIEATTSAGASVGTVDVNGRVGGMIRIGDNLQSNFGPARIRPSLTGSGHFDHANPFDWFVFVGVQGRAVGHDIFLDGSLFNDDGPSTPKNTFVGDLQAGAALTWGGAQLSWTYVHRTERFEAQNGDDGFGALTLSVKF